MLTCVEKGLRQVLTRLLPQPDRGPEYWLTMMVMMVVERRMNKYCILYLLREKVVWSTMRLDNRGGVYAVRQLVVCDTLCVGVTLL